MAKLAKVEPFTGKDGNGYIRLSFDATIDKTAKTVIQPKTIILPGEKFTVYKDLVGFEMSTSEV